MKSEDFIPLVQSDGLIDSAILLASATLALMTRPSADTLIRKRINTSTYTDLRTEALRYFLTLGYVHPQWRTGCRRYVFEQFPTAFTERIRRPVWCAPEPLRVRGQSNFRCPLTTLDMWPMPRPIGAWLSGTRNSVAVGDSIKTALTPSRQQPVDNLCK